jgi:hypothetical protein
VLSNPNLGAACRPRRFYAADVGSRRSTIAKWSVAVCTCAGVLAGLVRATRWAFVLCLAIASLAFVLLVVAGLPDLISLLNDRARLVSARRRQRRPAFTDSWRHTTDGMEASALMTSLQRVFSHPSQGGPKVPSVTIATLVACDHLGEAPGASQLRDLFLQFLGEPPVSEFVRAITGASKNATWRSYAGNGRLTNEAVLVDGDAETPVASAIMLLSDGADHRFGHDSRCAELVVGMRSGVGQRRLEPTGLEHWHHRLVGAVSIVTAFASFIDGDVGLPTHDDPAAQLGIRLDACRTIRELVDPGDSLSIEGAVASSSFLNYLLADRASKTPDAVCLDVLTTWCDYALHVHGYEAQLAGIVESPTSWSTRTGTTRATAGGEHSSPGDASAP